MTPSALAKTKRELRAARSALERMQNAPNFEAFETAWRELLNALEKSWKKVERECQVVRSQFEPWQRKKAETRKQDPLLSYLLHARNADSHTIQDIVHHTPGGIGLGPSRGNTWYVKHLEIRNGRVVRYEGDQPMKVTLIPSKIALLPVIDRGVTYPPPTTHMGKPLTATDPISVATLGLAFYESTVSEAEQQFFNR